MRIGFDFPEGKNVSLMVEQNGSTATGAVNAWKRAQQNAQLDAGRRHRLPLVPADPASLPIPVVIQGDGTAVYDLTSIKTAGSLTFQATDGTSAVLDYTEAVLERGWPEGEHYFLPLDSSGRSIVEPGRNHRKFYITSGAHGYTKAMIAAEAGIAESAVTDSWIVSSIYGATEAKPLEATVGISAFNSCIGNGKADASHWLLLERGYSYPGITPMAWARGESAIHPIYQGAWGTGPKPKASMGQGSSRPRRFLVRRDIEALGVGAGNVSNIFYEDCDFRGPAELAISAAEAAGAEGATLRRITIFDVARDRPVDGQTDWKAASNNRFGGVYTSGVDGVLFDQCTVDLTGWAENYDPINAAWNNGEFGQPPSYYSHNFYLSAMQSDVMMRETWTSRAASQGIQARASGYFIDNIIVENPLGVGRGSGVESGGHGMPVAYGLFLGNIVEGSCHRPVYSHRGAYGTAQSIWPVGCAMIQHITAHPADPNDPADVSAKAGQGFLLDYTRSFTETDFAYDVVTQGGWGRPDRGVVVSQGQANATTVGKYFQHFHGGDGTRKDAYRLVRQTLSQNFAKELARWYRIGFGLPVPPTRSQAATMTFSPDTRADGFQWFNRLNWSLKELPRDGDSVDLNGNFTRFGSLSLSVAAVELGGAKLDVVSGRLTAAAVTGAGAITVRKCGQMFLAGGVADHDVTVRGGRFAVTGAHRSRNLSVSGRSETLFGPDFTLPVGAELRVTGSLPFVGWDGAGSAVLRLQGKLRLESALRVTVPSGITYKLREGRAVTFPNGSAVVDDFNMVSDSLKFVTLREATATPAAGDTLTATPTMQDQRFNTSKVTFWDPQAGSITAVTASMPTIRRFRSGMHGLVDPTVTPAVELAGALELDLRGMAAGTYPLIEATITGAFSGLTVTNLATTLDATVTVTGSGVTLTLAAGTGQSSLV